MTLNYEFITTSLLNGISFGLLLFMLSAGLTLIYSMMGVLNFAHASFYMIGAFFAYQSVKWLTPAVGGDGAFWLALMIAPLLVGALGALTERFGLRKVHQYGHVPELLFTFGLSFIVLELIKLIWGLQAVPFRVPEVLDGALFTVFDSTFPKYRGFMMAVALAMLLALYLGLTRTRMGLVIQAALTHPDSVQTLGHNVPRVFMMMFAFGCALAALAGVIAGPAMTTEPNMAAAVGPIIFVVAVVGGMGSLTGAFIASILLGLIQTFAVGSDASLMGLLANFDIRLTPKDFGYSVVSLKVSQTAPILPYLILVLMLIFRPKGLMGTREG